MNRNAILFIMLFATLVTGADTVILNFPDSSTVNDSLIKLSAIAQIRSENKMLLNKVSGIIAGNAAPPGFSRLLGIDDMLMYRVRPRFPGVSFVTEGKKRVSVRTACRICKIKEIQPEIKKYLDTALHWKRSEWSFEIANPEQIWRGYNAPFDVSIDGLTSHYAKGNTMLKCNFLQGAGKSVIRVLCRIKVTTHICVTKHDIGRGTVLSKDDIEFITRDITSFAPGYYAKEKELIGLKTVVTINAGKIIQKRMVCRIPDVENGDNVEIIYNKGRIRCVVQGTARESGNTGEKIWVQNNQTRQLLRVKITSKGIVEIV